MREIAPSHELRRWFSHDPRKWEEFKRRYWEEIKDKKELRDLIDIAKRADITLLFSARTTVYNNAVALKEIIERIIDKHETL
jgi:uncharacterized protein YeaO (DUF488 family)